MCRVRVLIAGPPPPAFGFAGAFTFQSKRMRFRPVLFVTVLLHLYIGVRILPELGALFPAAPWLVAGALTLSVLLMPLGLVATRIARPPLADVLTWIGLLFMGLFSSLFVLTLVRDLALLVLQIAALVVPGQLPLASVRRLSAAAVPVLGLLASLLGFLNARRTAAVVRVDVPIRGLAPQWHGFSFAQISDIHVGPTIKQRYLRRIVNTVNALDVDVVAVTGDLVDGQVSELALHVAPLAELTSRHGTYFVTGNHEYYSGAHAWIDELRRLGLTVLLNQHVLIRTPGVEHETLAPLVLAGVTDFNAGHFDPAHKSDPHAALAGAPPDASVRILLAHQPRSAAAAATAGFDLQLSGHTHGGQFFPWNLFVRFQQPFTSGLHRLENLWVYTSRGTGYWGPPKRFGAPSEITLVRLVAG